MKRGEYLSDQYVRCFVDWLRPRVRGDDPFEHAYWLRRPPRHWWCRSLWEAHEKYCWQRHGVEDTQRTLEGLRRELCAAVQRFDNDRFVEAARGVLQWGGVAPHNTHTLCGLGQRALETFREAACQLDPFRADTSHLNAVRYMNSGWTKVYALMLGDFPMYDGRVGAAMGYLVRLYCIDKDLRAVPRLLRFRWLPGRSSPNSGHNRNPSAGSLRFPRLSHQAPRSWAECNVRAAWILGAATCAGPFAELPKTRRMRAIESALFMIGYELPRGCPEPPGNWPVSSTIEGAS